MQKYEFHEVANIFPMMTDDEFKELVTSIDNNGQREPIMLYQNKIIDGRNRYNACIQLDIEPYVQMWDEQGSLLEFVKDKNLNRRQLTQSQRAMVGARMVPLYEVEAKERQIKLAGTRPTRDLGVNLHQGERTPRTVELVGGMVGVGGSSVFYGKKVLDDGVPELVAAVEKNEVAVHKAHEIAKLPKEQQVTALADYRKKKETPQPRQPRIDKEEVKRKTAEWMEKNKTEFTEEDKRLNAMVDEIVIATTKSLQEISNFVPTMSSKANLYTILRRAIRAADKYTNDLESIEFNNRAKEGVE